MKRSTNFNGMKQYRRLGMDEFVAACKAVKMTDGEIIEAVRKIQANQTPPKPAFTAESLSVASGQSDSV